MKKVLFPSFLAFVLLACNSAAPPKEVATEFVQAVQAANAAKAADLATTKTKTAVASIKTNAGSQTAGNELSLANLTETINGNTAEVKNENLTVLLEKEGSDWKVAATPELLAALTENPENLAQLKYKWEALVKEYNGRLNVAKEYVQYKKGQGALSVPMQNLEQMVNKLSAGNTADKETPNRYVQNQQELEALLDKAHEPTQTAHADLSMNYFLQLSQAADRIKAAQKDYNEAVAKMPSVMYPSLSVR